MRRAVINHIFKSESEEDSRDISDLPSRSSDVLSISLREMAVELPKLHEDARVCVFLNEWYIIVR